MKNKKILFMLSGSVACYKACETLSQLVKQGCEVKTATTKSTAQFVGNGTLEGLTGNKNFENIYENDQMMDHIHLARWADATLLCPATANIINKMGCGLADDTISTLFLAWQMKEKPFLIAPAMNTFMWQHPSTAENASRLAAWGCTFVGPESGNLACGEEGEGRLAETSDILAALEQALATKRHK